MSENGEKILLMPEKLDIKMSKIKIRKRSKLYTYGNLPKVYC